MSIRISVDEMMSRRKSIMSGSTMFKAAKAPSTWNPEKRSVRIVMSAQVQDRDGDLVMIEGIDTKEFEKNPISLWLHSQAMPIGSWSNLEKVMNARPKRLEGDHEFAPEEIDETADRIARLASVGIIRAASIGFLPDWNEAEAIVDDDKRFKGIRFNKTNLLESSLVAIPANQVALGKIASDEDRKLATSLLEEVLDNWVKTPAGLFMTKAEYETSHKMVVGDRTMKTVSLKEIEDEPEAPPAPPAEPEIKTLEPPAERTMTINIDAKSPDEGLLTRIAKFLGLHKEEAENEPPPPPAPASAERKSAATARAEAAMKRAQDTLAQGA